MYVLLSLARHSDQTSLYIAFWCGQYIAVSMCRQLAVPCRLANSVTLGATSLEQSGFLVYFTLGFYCAQSGPISVRNTKMWFEYLELEGMILWN